MGPGEVPGVLGFFGDVSGDSWGVSGKRREKERNEQPPKALCVHVNIYSYNIKFSTYLKIHDGDGLQ